MRLPLIVGVTALTAAGGYLYGKEVLGLSNRELATAWKTTLECVWFSLGFFALNLLVAFAGILASRVAFGRFVSIYNLSDITLLILSILQGIMFQLWRGETARLGR